MNTEAPPIYDGIQMSPDGRALYQYTSPITGSTFYALSDCLDVVAGAHAEHLRRWGYSTDITPSFSERMKV